MGEIFRPPQSLGLSGEGAVFAESARPTLLDLIDRLA